MGEPIDCREAKERLQDYLKRELTPELADEVQEHLVRCRSCFGRAKFEETPGPAARGAGPAGDLPRRAARADPRPAARTRRSGAEPGPAPLAAARRPPRRRSWRTARPRSPVGRGGGLAGRNAGARRHRMARRRGSRRLLRLQQPRLPRRAAAGAARPQGRAARPPAGARQRRRRRAVAALLGLRDPALGLWLLTATLAGRRGRHLGHGVRRAKRGPRPGCSSAARRYRRGTSGGVTAARHGRRRGRRAAGRGRWRARRPAIRRCFRSRRW